MMTNQSQHHVTFLNNNHFQTSGRLSLMDLIKMQ